MGICERKKELKRRRKRREQLRKFRVRLEKAPEGKDRDHILTKIRRMSPDTAIELAAAAAAK